MVALKEKVKLEKVKFKKRNRSKATYNFSMQMENNILNNPRFYELRFTPVFPYETELGISTKDKIGMLSNIITYLENRNIFVTFTDRILDDSRPWEHENNQNWRYLPMAELQGNNICINPRNIDFLSIYMSIGHIYGHLVQRMEEEKYKPITDFIELPKPLNLDNILRDYKLQYGGDYKEDFLQFEIEAFRYAKYAFMKAGNKFSEMLDYAMNIYIEADFNELWRWVSENPQKSGQTFMDEFQKLWHLNKNKYQPLLPKEIEFSVVPDSKGTLVVVRDN